MTQALNGHAAAAPAAAPASGPAPDELERLAARVDKAVELTYMEPSDKKRMAKRILGAFEKPYLEMLAFVDEYPDLQETPAQFQERCAQIALRAFWKDKYAAEAKPSVQDVAEELLKPSLNGAY